MRPSASPQRPPRTTDDVELVVAAILMGLLMVLTALAAPLIVG